MTTQRRRSERGLHAVTTIARAAIAHLVASVRRSALQHPRRFALLGGVAAIAVVVGGPAGVLLAIFALMVGLDAVIPMPGATWSQADERFWRLVRERRHARRVLWRRRVMPERLVVVDEGEGWVAVAQRRALGVQPIRVDSVTGTVEPAKARVFDGRFRPERSAQEHWKGIWMAYARGQALPPIAVYRVGAQHIVRDGHHRISVARDRHLDLIDADVVELLRGRTDAPAACPAAADASSDCAVAPGARLSPGLTTRGDCRGRCGIA